jgi:hypothetical protein
MGKEQVAKEMVDFFYHTYSDLMPNDPREKLRVETMIQDKVYSEINTGFDEDTVINDIVDRLKKKKAEGDSWLEKELKKREQKKDS